MSAPLIINRTFSSNFVAFSCRGSICVENKRKALMVVESKEVEGKERLPEDCFRGSG